MGGKSKVEYAVLLREVSDRLSTASTLEEVQAEVVKGLRELVERRGEGRLWLVKAFQLIDADAHAGKGICMSV